MANFFDQFAPKPDQTPAPAAPASRGSTNFFSQFVTPGAAQEQAPIDQGGMGGLRAFTSSLNNGIPIVGPALTSGENKISAGIMSLMGNGDYQTNLDKINQAQSEAQAAHPHIAALGAGTGAAAASIPMAAVAPEAFGISGAPLLKRVATAAVTGGTINGTDAAIRSGNDPWQTAKGVGLGAAFGAAGPLVGRGIGYMLSDQAPAAAGLPSKALDYVKKTLSPPGLLPEQAGALQRLGPDATLADVSPAWMGVARSAASQPAGRDAVVQALISRDAGKNVRLGADLNESLGPAPVPSQVDASLAASQNAVAKGYAPLFENAKAVDTQGIANDLESAATNLRGPAQAAVQKVRGYLDIPGTDQLDPHPQALFQTRQAIDGMMANEQNPKVIQQLSAVRQNVDGALAKAVPGIKDVDAQFAELARQRDALQQGTSVLDAGKSAIRPAEMDQTMTQGALPQGTQVGPSAAPYRIRQGARGEIDRVVGTANNDPAALQRLVQGEGDWNRTKLGTIFGQDNADHALNALDRERIFNQTSNRVTSGSDTAQTNQFNQKLNEIGKPMEIPSNISALGIAGKAAEKLVRSILGNSAERGASQFTDVLGKMATAQGPERDRIIQALLGHYAQPAPNPMLPGIASSALLSTGRQLAAPH